jgi:hypothetical protein
MAQFKRFAKLFEHPEYCQILMIRGYDEETGDETVEVSACTTMAGICTTVVSFGSAEDADESFKELDLEDCLYFLKPVKEAIDILGAAEDAV